MLPRFETILQAVICSLSRYESCQPRIASWCAERWTKRLRAQASEHLSFSRSAPRALILVSRPWIMQRPLLAWFSAWALFIYERARSHPHLQSADDFVWIIECPCPAQTAFSCSRGAQASKLRMYSERESLSECNSIALGPLWLARGDQISYLWEYARTALC